MKNNSVTVSCIFFVLFSMFHVLQAYSAENRPSSATSSTAVKADTRRLISKIKGISSSIKLKENQRSRLQKKIFFFDKKIQRLGLKHQKLLIRQSEIQDRLAGLEQERSALIADIDVAKQSMAQLARAFYYMKSPNPAKALINGESLSDISREKVNYDYLITDYRNQYQSLKTQHDKLAKLDHVLEKKLNALEKLAEKNRHQAATLKASYRTRSAALTKLLAGIKSDKSKMALLKRDQRRLEKLAKAIAKLKQKKSSGISFAKHKGGLKWPVQGRVLKKFGRTRSGTRLKWAGVLIETNAGASVSSVAAGRVVFSDWLSGYGFMLIIEHGRGYMSSYAHNQQLMVNVGDRVRENQQIALAGSSGRSGKPALYFEIRFKGKPVNPEKWMLARNRR